MKSIIPKNRFQFTIRKRIGKNIPIDQAYGFPCFLFGEILALKGQDVGKQALVSSVTGVHFQKLHVGVHRRQPSGKNLNFIFWAILKNGPIHTLELHNCIAVVSANLGIRFNAQGKGFLCPAFPNIPFRVAEIEVFSTGGFIYPAFQTQILDNLKQKIRSLSVININ